MLIRWPKAELKGHRVDTHVSILDLYPTLVDLAGLKPPENKLHGQSLAPRFVGGTLAPQSIYATLHPPRPRLLRIRDGRWKLILDLRKNGRPKLFNLEVDPGELYDVAKENQELVLELSLKLNMQFKGLPSPPERMTITPEKGVKEQLEALGYVD